MGAPSAVVRPLRATVITDASFCPQKAVGGWAAWIRYDGDKGPLCESGPLRGKLASSTEAEVRAALNGIWLARVRAGATHVLLQSDCMAVIHLWDGRAKSALLVDLWASALARDDMAGVQLEVRHVKGHGVIKDARTYVNDWCDRYARQHMEKERRHARGRPR